MSPRPRPPRARLLFFFPALLTARLSVSGGGVPSRGRGIRNAFTVAHEGISPLRCRCPPAMTTTLYTHRTQQARFLQIRARLDRTWTGTFARIALVLACTSRMSRFMVGANWSARINAPRKDSESVDPWFLAEFSCWTMVALATILTWPNGPSVSTDRFIVRIAACCLALGGGIGLGVAKLLARKRGKGDER